MKGNIKNIHRNSSSIVLACYCFLHVYGFKRFERETYHRPWASSSYACYLWLDIYDFNLLWRETLTDIHRTSLAVSASTIYVKISMVFIKFEEKSNIQPQNYIILFIWLLFKLRFLWFQLTWKRNLIFSHRTILSSSACFYLNLHIYGFNSFGRET